MLRTCNQGIVHTNKYYHLLSMTTEMIVEQPNVKYMWLSLTFNKTSVKIKDVACFWEIINSNFLIHIINMSVKK